ncbi:hypothetical protein POM88_017284 [Heracleum sosnowskyi]|uniref:Uncharacterized protein n=1 Tax=Heracleum sosnowskyi TaxID=360622 RepID=A0AAD8IP72_9APIA|nr:hypothetical protein POM88_017284 [Heracleum sosnowskyi]
MDITRELVRSVFPKISLPSCDMLIPHFDMPSHIQTEEDSASIRSSKVTVSTQPEFSSVHVHVEEDPASSVGSSEATIKQPLPLGLIDAVDAKSRQTNGGIQEKQNSTSRLHNKDDATTIIQSPIRSFLARRQIEGLNLRDVIDNFAVGAGSRRSGSTGTSIEFQTWITTGVDSFRDKMGSMPQPPQVKGRPQGLKLKVNQHM